MPELYYSGVIAAGFSGHSAIVQELNFKKMYSKLFKDDLNHVPWDLFWNGRRGRTHGMFSKTCS